MFKIFSKAVKDCTLSSLNKDEIPQAIKLLNNSFRLIFFKLLRKAPWGKGEGDRVKKRFFRKDTTTIALRDENNNLRGVCLIQRDLNEIIVGPAAVDFRLKNPASFFKKVEHYLSKQLTEDLLVNSVTFPHSPLHMASHLKSFEPLFPCAFLSKPLKKNIVSNSNSKVILYSNNETSIREQLIKEIDLFMTQFNTDLTNEITYIFNEKIGEILIFKNQYNKIDGVACCHFGLNSETFDKNQFLIKKLYFSPQNEFTEAIQTIESFAKNLKYKTIGMMASTGRKICLKNLLEMDYKIESIHSHWGTSRKIYDSDLNSEGFIKGKELLLDQIRASDYVLSEMR